MERRFKFTFESVDHESFVNFLKYAPYQIRVIKPQGMTLKMFFTHIRTRRFSHGNNVREDVQLEINGSTFVKFTTERFGINEPLRPVVEIFLQDY